MKRTPLQSICVQRDGASVVPPIGIPFDFTADEVKQIEAMNPDAISTEAMVNVAEDKAAAPAPAAPTKAGKSVKEDL